MYLILVYYFTWTYCTPTQVVLILFRFQYRSLNASFWRQQCVVGRKTFRMQARATEDGPSKPYDGDTVNTKEGVGGGDFDRPVEFISDEKHGKSQGCEKTGEMKTEEAPEAHRKKIADLEVWKINSGISFDN